MSISPTAELKSWCSIALVDIDYALMVIIPTKQDIETSELEDILDKVLGRVKVRRKMFSDEKGVLKVLCETRVMVDADKVPSEVSPGEDLESWTVVAYKETTDAAEDFNSKLNALLQAEGKTEEDLQALLAGKATPQATPQTPTEAILRAVGDLLDKTAKPQSESGSYRRLRIFSGVIPTPVSEEPFDHWVEQANLMVEESESNDKEKRRRIFESLKGPALEIFKAVRLSDPDVSPKGCIKALEGAFGTAESGEDLYFSFRLMQQQEGEKLSDFLRRLERSLTKVVQRGGLQDKSIDQARVEQLLRGAVKADLMLIQLRLRERRTTPPTFLELLNEIHKEEEYEPPETD